MLANRTTLADQFFADRQPTKPATRSGLPVKIAGLSRGGHVAWRGPDDLAIRKPFEAVVGYRGQDPHSSADDVISPSSFGRHRYDRPLQPSSRAPIVNDDINVSLCRRDGIGERFAHQQQKRLPKFIATATNRRPAVTLITSKRNARTSTTPPVYGSAQESVHLSLR